MPVNPYVIPEDKILERLRFENPWWSSKRIARTVDEMPRRLYFELFYPRVKDRSVNRALILMGPRRVGKTVMMQHAVQKLIDEGALPTSVAFVGVDNPIYIHLGLEELMRLAAKASKQDSVEGMFVFFDEIQYLKDWERHLKVLVDSYPSTKFVVSGSAAAALRMKSTESGAGRFNEFMLPPLTFQEFLHLQDLNHLVRPAMSTYKGKKIPFYEAIDIRALNEQYFDYLNYGGYPEVIFNATVRSDMPRFVKSDIIDKVLLRDLPSLYGITDVQELNRFFTFLAYNTGKEFAFQKMAKDSGIDVPKLRRYLEYLQAAFLINIVHKVDENARHFKRVSAFKVYLTNPSLRTALFSPVLPTDEEAGNLVETAIYAQWIHRENLKLHYARWKSGRQEGEVDMVMLDSGTFKASWAFEIKWSNRYVGKPAELKSLISFCRNNALEAAVVTTIDKQEQVVEQGVELNFYPASLYTYVVGANTLTAKNT